MVGMWTDCWRNELDFNLKEICGILQELGCRINKKMWSPMAVGLNRHLLSVCCSFYLCWFMELLNCLIFKICETPRNKFDLYCYLQNRCNHGIALLLYNFFLHFVEMFRSLSQSRISWKTQFFRKVSYDGYTYYSWNISLLLFDSLHR